MLEQAAEAAEEVLVVLLKLPEVEVELAYMVRDLMVQGAQHTQVQHIMVMAVMAVHLVVQQDTADLLVIQ
jgi:hypothetical protein